MNEKRMFGGENVLILFWICPNFLKFATYHLYNYNVSYNDDVIKYTSKMGEGVRR